MRSAAAYLAALVWITSGARAAEPGPSSPDLTCSSSGALSAYSRGLALLYTGDGAGAAQAFRAAAREDPKFAMTRWGLSRAYLQIGQDVEALAESVRAMGLSTAATDREQRIIATWNRLLLSRQMAPPDRESELRSARAELDAAISMYPDDPEIWLQRAFAAPGPLRAAPFHLAALRVDPHHPLRAVWKAPAPPPLPPPPTIVPPPVRPPDPTPLLFEGLGELRHPITTSSAEAQAYYEQGLRCHHAYVTPASVKNGAGACFQYAAALDPDCAMAHWGLSFCNPVGMKEVDVAARAYELSLRRGTDKERMMCGARLLEVQGRREAFLDLLEAAICRYPDDVELWIWRGKAHGTGPECIPFQIAAHVLAPEHPSPNHELVHAYEGIDRPALGWPYTIGFRQSAPNMPHAHHMQAHLAMRLGRWQEAIDATRMSRKKSLEGFPELDPSHHIDILIRALAHEGRFREAESEPRAYRQGLPWARLLLLKAVPQEIEAWTETRLKSGSPDGNYIAAVHRLEIGDLAGTKPHLDRIEEQFRKSPGNIYRNHEVKGRYLVEMGRVEEGLRLLREAAARAVKDPGLHAWGGGSYVLEAWGRAALRAQRWEEAVEAFHEALAHEHGSIIGALGMQVVAERRGDAALAAHYADRARRIWKDADPGALERNLAHLRRLAGAGPEGLHKP